MCSENLLKGDDGRAKDGRPHVLIIESDQFLGENLLRYIERHMGWSGCLASSVTQARLLCESEAHFDLIVMDSQMRDANCLDCIREMKARMHKVLVMSGSVNFVSKNVVLDRGADDFLTKPFSLQEFRDRILPLVPQETKRGKRSLKLSVKRPGSKKVPESPEHKTFVRLSDLPKLSRTQQIIARELDENFGQVVKRVDLFPKVFQEDYVYGKRDLDVQISRMRNKLKKLRRDDGSKSLEISPVYGVGYILRYVEDRES